MTRPESASGYADRRGNTSAVSSASGNTFRNSGQRICGVKAWYWFPFLDSKNGYVNVKLICGAVLPDRIFIPSETFISDCRYTATNFNPIAFFKHSERGTYPVTPRSESRFLYIHRLAPFFQAGRDIYPVRNVYLALLPHSNNFQSYRIFQTFRTGYIPRPASDIPRPAPGCRMGYLSRP